MRTEVRRGRKFIEYIDDSLPAGTFVQEISGADVSYQDDDAIWIHDPWDNLTIRLRDRYKKPIQQFSSYRRAL